VLGATHDLTCTFPGRFSVLLGPNNAGNPLDSCERFVAVSRPMCADVRAHPFPRANSEATGCLAWTNKSPFGTGGKRRGR
jgi:hypothetical protein